MKRPIITDRQREILETLKTLRARNEGARNIEGQRWATPLEFGGTDGSHHSATVRQLVKKRYVACTHIGYGAARGSACYRITDAGLAVLEAN